MDAMPRLEKPRAIQITIRDRRTGKSKSRTVYDTTLDEVYKTIERVFGGKGRVR